MPPSSPPAPTGASASPKAEKKSAKRQKQIMGQTTGVLDYLHKSLSRSSLVQLYAVPDHRGQLVCRAVFQQLSQATQQVIMRLLCTGGVFPRSSLNVWIPKTGTVDRVLKELYKWAILSVDGGGDCHNNSNSLVRMTPEFQKGLQESLAQLEASPWVPLTQAQLQALQNEANKQQQKAKTANNNPVIVTTEDLERYTQSQWDAVLHFLVGTVGPNIKEPPPAVVHFLLQTGLMQTDPDYKGRDIEQAPLVITQKGYEFMLQDTVQQVWHFCVQYLLSLESHKRKELAREALLVLISLSFARVGYAYNCGDLNKDGRVMMKDLALFGLLYTCKVGKTTIFYPTRIAMQLVGGDGQGEGSKSSSSRSARWSLSSKALESSLAHPRPHDSSHLAIIVQTNFQLCAYTTSELHVSMLALFCDIQTIRRLPNVVFMTITRDSIKSAFNLGIQARQILRFLEKHAHPRLRTQNTENTAYTGPIPSNIVDQIWLWDRELSRVTFTPVYQHECLLQGEFAAIKAYATDRKALAYCNERRQQLWIDYRQVERIQHFARQWRARQAARQKDMEE